MQLNCTNCGKILAFVGEKPAFCSFCGASLSAAGLHEAATIAGPALERAPFIHADSPQTIAGYRLFKKLGQGGMGTVWEAEDEQTERRVAIKLLSPDLPRNDETTGRFLREARLAAAISHPRSTFIFGAGDDQGRPYIVMELMPGSTLKDVVDREGPLPIAAAVGYILDVIEGLAAAHAKGVIHRDVKPSNCFLDGDGRVKVGDYGLSKSLVADTQLTMTGAFLGTPAFAAPEQVKGDTIDTRTDVYSVGATLFYLLTGRAPFRGDPAAVCAQIAADTAPGLRTIRAELPRELEQIVARSLSKAPSRRFASLARFRRALLPFAGGAVSMATVGRRVAAYMVDVLLFWMIAFTVLAMTFAMIIRQSQAGNDSTIKFIVQFAFWAIPILYFMTCEALWGRGIGKRLLRLRVVRLQGEPPGWTRALVRSLFIPGGLGIPLVLFSSSPWWQQSLLWLFYAICALPMRSRNGYRGLHDLASGSRVILLRPAALTAAIQKVPVVAPLAQEPGSQRYGPFGLTGSLGTSATAQVLSAYDDLLGRAVWIYHHPSDVAFADAARLQIRRPARLRWLQRGVVPNGSWDAYEAVVGSPLSECVAQREGITWDRARLVLVELAEELEAAVADKSLPHALTLDQVWVDQSGRVKLLDAPIALGGAGNGAADDTSLLPCERAVRLLRAAASICTKGAMLPRYARDFVVELQERSADTSALPWAAKRLREIADRSSVLKWDDRLGILCCSAGTETLLFMTICILMVSSLTGQTALPAYAVVMLSFLVALAVVAALGFWPRGGPVFRLVGVEVLRLNGDKASRTRCALRNTAAWLPKLFAFVMLVSMSTGVWFMAPRQPAQSANVNEAAPAAGTATPAGDSALPAQSTGRTPLRDPLQGLGVMLSFFAAMGLMSFVDFVGTIWALAQPQRGLQDVLAGTYIAPRG